MNVCFWTGEFFAWMYLHELRPKPHVHLLCCQVPSPGQWKLTADPVQLAPSCLHYRPNEWMNSHFSSSTPPVDDDVIAPYKTMSFSLERLSSLLFQTCCSSILRGLLEANSFPVLLVVANNSSLAPTVVPPGNTRGGWRVSVCTLKSLIVCTISVLVNRQSLIPRLSLQQFHHELLIKSDICHSHSGSPSPRCAHARTLILV